MRRQDLQLLAAARQGDLPARLEVARRYLSGTDGFARHVQTGLDYLQHQGLRNHLPAMRTVVDNLSLHELIERGLLSTRVQAAELDHAAAQAKLAAWRLTRPGGWADARCWLQRSAGAGLSVHLLGADNITHDTCVQSEPPAIDATAPDADERAAMCFESLARAGVFDPGLLLGLAIQRAMVRDDAQRACWCLALAARCLPSASAGLAQAAVQVLALASRCGGPLTPVPVAWIEAALQRRAADGDPQAIYLLGCALSGLACGACGADALVNHGNLRKGLALLLRAADAGMTQSWMHLYRLSADHRSSVSNPPMARFFLEKAAQQGDAVAQRMLGALTLRESGSLAASEQALHWLHQAGAQGDALAHRLLATLVLPVTGEEQAATAALQAIGQAEPALAARLAVARQFGLTKLETLSFDPATSIRPWGLVIGINPHIRKQRLAAARAVPALNPAAMTALRTAAGLFGRDDRRAAQGPGDMQRRARSMQRLFERTGAQESSFFAQASANTLETLRQGPKWAWRMRSELRLALQCPA